ncbi:MAG: DUF4215 domain-containing protein [Myxococcota bacterium]|nr:DUF4215 domain-containing protein [Myxococcota bacterium]
MISAVTCAVIQLHPMAATAQEAATMSYHGMLWATNGQPLEGPRTLQLRLYQSPEAGLPIWEERHENVPLIEGRFAIVLGRSQPLPDFVSVGEALYLGVRIDEGEELSPRQPVGVSLRALRSRLAGVAEHARDVSGEAIDPASVSVRGRRVIDEGGRWVGEPTGLQGPRGRDADLSSDQDADGFPDWIEQSLSTDPADPESKPADENEDGIADAIQGPKGPDGEQGPPGEVGPPGAPPSIPELARQLAADDAFRAALVSALISDHGDALRGPPGPPGLNAPGAEEAEALGHFFVDEYPASGGPWPLLRADLGGIRVPMEIEAIGALSGLSLRVQLTHPSLPHLQIRLFAPDGRSRLIFDGPSGSGAELPETAEALTLTFPTDLVPVEALDTLTGINASGEWVLELIDSDLDPRDGAPRTLDSWSLFVERQDLSAWRLNGDLEVGGRVISENSCELSPVVVNGAELIDVIELRCGSQPPVRLTTYRCGNGRIDPGESCDDGNLSLGDDCDEQCRPTCGNLRVDPGEGCDDGNDDDRDGCLNNCQVARCGDGVLHVGTENCDLGDGRNSDQPGAICRPNCEFGGCGDGIQDPGEECDDGNQEGDDDCPAFCRVRMSFEACIGRSCMMRGIEGQGTRCEVSRDEGLTCINPVISYGSVVGGIPHEHPENDYLRWCTSMGFGGFDQVLVGERSCEAPQGKVFWCEEGEIESGHWCDWRDTFWRDQSLDSHDSCNRAITELRCLP